MQSASDPTQRQPQQTVTSSTSFRLPAISPVETHTGGHCNSCPEVVGLVLKAQDWSKTVHSHFCDRCASTSLVARAIKLHHLTEVTVPEHTHHLTVSMQPYIEGHGIVKLIKSRGNIWPLLTQESAKIGSLVTPFPLILTLSNQIVSSIWHFYKCLKGFVFKLSRTHYL